MFDIDPKSNPKAFADQFDSFPCCDLLAHSLVFTLSLVQMGAMETARSLFFIVLTTNIRILDEPVLLYYGHTDRCQYL